MRNMCTSFHSYYLATDKMKHSLSEQAVDKIRGILGSALEQARYSKLTTRGQVDENLDKILEAMASDVTFSESIGGGKKKKEPWKCHFPVLMIRALMVLMHAHKPMTVKEISTHCNPPWDERGQFTKLKHWNLIESVEGGYKATEDAKRFIDGELLVPEFLCVLHDLVVTESKEEDNANKVYIWDLKHHQMDAADIIDYFKVPELV